MPEIVMDGWRRQDSRWICDHLKMESSDADLPHLNTIGEVLKRLFKKFLRRVNAYLGRTQNLSSRLWSMQTFYSSHIKQDETNTKQDWCVLIIYWSLKKKSNHYAWCDRRPPDVAGTRMILKSKINMADHNLSPWWRSLPVERGSTVRQCKAQEPHSAG